MLVESEGCREFRETLHRYLDDDLALVDQATFVGHLSTCSSCRGALLQFSEHIQAHRILAAGGRLDSESKVALRAAVPAEFASISNRVVRSRARTLGRLKLQILQVYLKHILSQHAWGPGVLDSDGLKAAQTASDKLLSNLERFEESSVIFADGGPVDLRQLKGVLDQPSEVARPGYSAQLMHIARGLLAARTLDPTLDDPVLHLLGAILEELGYYPEARQMFLALAELMAEVQPHKRARALSSAARTSLRFLGEYEQALSWLLEADRLFPNRWTIEYNLASWYVWPANPHRALETGRLWLEKCIRDCRKPEQLQNFLRQDTVMAGLFQGMLSGPSKGLSTAAVGAPVSAGSQPLTWGASPDIVRGEPA